MFVAFKSALIVTVGTLLAINSSMKCGGIRMSPFRLPLILITPRKDLPLVTVEFRKLTTLAIEAADPVVALPAVVFASTVASPLRAARSIVLSIVCETLLASVILRSPLRLLLAGWTAPMSAGFSRISPFTSPLILDTNVTALPPPPKPLVDDCSRFMTVAIDKADPVEASPASVFPKTVAFPEVADDEMLLATAMLVEFVAVAEALLDVFGVVAEAVAEVGVEVLKDAASAAGFGPPTVIAPDGGVVTDEVRR